MYAKVVFLTLGLACLGGCTSLFKPVPAGVVTGMILYNGQPAAGKRVILGRSQKFARTDAQGRYVFSGVSIGQSTYVKYEVEVDRPGVRPNEIAVWQSVPFVLEGGQGKEVPAIEVAYNGVLYPHESLSLIVGPKSPVPFHWSTHPHARGYRLIISEFEGEDFSWSSEWGREPIAIFAQEVAPGWYNWAVEIDGGDRGTGLSRTERVNF